MDRIRFLSTPGGDGVTEQEQFYYREKS